MRSLLVVLAVVVVTSCKQQQPPAPVAPPPPPPKPKEETVTLLITGSENGALLAATNEAGERVGGAAETLGRWVTKEGHCAGALKAEGAPACADGSTLVLSTGDNSYGAAISSVFHGASTAAVMATMGYAASAFGNHEVDFGRPQFARNRTASGITYLAANITSAPEQESSAPISVEPFKVFTRRGLKIGVIGLTTQKLPTSTVPGRLDGLTVAPDEDALVKVMPDVSKSGANAVVLLSDGCLEELADVLKRHEDWHVAVVAGRACSENPPETAGGAKLVQSGSQFRNYARAQLSFEGTTLKDVKTSVEQVTGSDAPDQAAQALIADWKKQLDEKLGEKIGYSKAGLALGSDQLSKWLTKALKEKFRADVGLINQHSVRQGLPKGAVTMAAVHDVIPFENRVVVVSVNGSALANALKNPEARFTGIKVEAIKPKKVYTVATHNFIYYGGDGFTLRKDEVKSNLTGEAWQDAVIEWTKKAGSTEKKPLETKL